MRAHPSGPARMLWVLVLVVLAAGTGGSVAAARLVAAEERDRADRLLEQRGAESRMAIGQELRRYRDLGAGTAGLLAAAPDLSRADYDRYAGGLDLAGRYPGAYALSFVVPVDDAALGALRAPTTAPSPCAAPSARAPRSP